MKLNNEWVEDIQQIEGSLSRYGKAFLSASESGGKPDSSYIDEAKKSLSYLAKKVTVRSKENGFYTISLGDSTVRMNLCPEYKEPWVYFSGDEDHAVRLSAFFSDASDIRKIQSYAERVYTVYYDMFLKDDVPEHIDALHINRKNMIKTENTPFVVFDSVNDEPLDIFKPTYLYNINGSRVYLPLKEVMDNDEYRAGLTKELKSYFSLYPDTVNSQEALKIQKRYEESLVCEKMREYYGTSPEMVEIVGYCKKNTMTGEENVVTLRFNFREEGDVRNINGPMVTVSSALDFTNEKEKMSFCRFVYELSQNGKKNENGYPNNKIRQFMTYAFFNNQKGKDLFVTNTKNLMMSDILHQYCNGMSDNVTHTILDEASARAEKIQKIERNKMMLTVQKKQEEDEYLKWKKENPHRDRFDRFCASITPLAMLCKGVGIHNTYSDSIKALKTYDDEITVLNMKQNAILTRIHPEGVTYFKKVLEKELKAERDRLERGLNNDGKSRELHISMMQNYHHRGPRSL